MEYILSTLVTAAAFVVLILLLAAKPKTSKIFTCIALGFGGICGLLIYGYGYAVVTDNFPLAILKAVLSVCRSFVGTNDYNAIAAAPFMQNQWMQLLCTFVQICSLYATASAVITSIGASALKQLRLYLGRRKHLNLIYSTNPNALGFGKELALQKNSTVIFVDPQPSASAIAAVASMGCVLQSNAPAVAANAKFLRQIGFSGNKRKLSVYALDGNSNNNIRYAAKLLSTLEALSVPPENTHLVLMAHEEIAVGQLQNTAQKYGYGFVAAVNEPQMAARLLTAKYPPCDVVSFGTDGKATTDFSALLIGFGQVGQAVLKSLVMNGQFEGSNFKLDVFAKDVSNVDGNITSQYGALFDTYNIQFHNYDAKSRQMYQYLKEFACRLQYIVIATGDSKNGCEIAEEILAFLNSIGHCISVYECNRSGVVAYNSDGTVRATHNIYSTGVLCSDELDQKAMILNHRYQADSQKAALQTWMECDYFSRQSCRAAVDFIPAMLRAAGKTGTQGDWDLTAEQTENLSKTEHLRWCAFHYCMGFTPMTDFEFNERAEIYQKQKEEGCPTIRIGKNMQSRTHACLIPWDALDSLSAKENAITGKSVDYKAMDTDNVLEIPQLLYKNEA